MIRLLFLVAYSIFIGYMTADNGWMWFVFGMIAFMAAICIRDIKQDLHNHIAQEHFYRLVRIRVK